MDLQLINLAGGGGDVNNVIRYEMNLGENH